MRVTGASTKTRAAQGCLPCAALSILTLPPNSVTLRSSVASVSLRSFPVLRKPYRPRRALATTIVTGAAGAALRSRISLMSLAAICSRPIAVAMV
jgi:hypothetical protein